MGSFLKFWLRQPSTLQASFCTVFLRKPLLFSLVSGLLEKSAQNSLERYRYGAPRLALRQNSKKSPHDLGALFLLPLARSPKDSTSLEFLRNSRISYRDPRVKPEDDIVWNSKIPNLKFHMEIPQRGWGMTGNSRIP